MADRCWIYKENEVSYGIEEEDIICLKKRLYEIAKELGKESKEVVARAKELGLDVKSHSSSVEAAAAEQIAASFKSAPALRQKQNLQHQKASVEKKAEKSVSAKPAAAKKKANQLHL